MQIILQGKTSSKMVNRAVRIVTPFVGVDTSSEYPQLGIGYFTEEETDLFFWGIRSPHLLIRTWRGMKILEEVGVIEVDTPCLCFSVATNTIHNYNNPHIEILGNQIEGIEELQQIRYKALDSFPDSKEIEQMMLRCAELEIKVDAHEIEDGIRTGRITSTPTLNALIDEVQENVEPTPGRKKLFGARIPLARKLLSVFSKQP